MLGKKYESLRSSHLCERYIMSLELNACYKRTASATGVWKVIAKSTDAPNSSLE